MKKIILTSISSLFYGSISLIANPLSANTVAGKVIDIDNKPIHSVTVSLLNAADSSLVKVEITDINGEFKFPTSVSGAYLLSYTNTGYEKKYSDAFILTEGVEIVLPTVKLTQITKKMQEVVVTSKKPIIEVKADKTIFNVENSITATGSNALEMLKKSPGVQVDNEDKISMNGKNGVKIYVDGKMLQMDEKNVSEYLKTITSNDMEAIEMISNPGAKYDAAGNAGIINIKLKKNKKFGTNGNASLGLTQGQTPKGNGAVSLNYRDKKINVFSNLTGNIGNRYQTINLERRQADTVFDMRSSQVSSDNNFNGKAGFDYFIDKKKTIGFMANASTSNRDWSSDGNTLIYYEPSMQLVKKLIAKNSVPQKTTNANFNANYRYADTTGKEINIDADYGLFRSKSNSFQPNIYYDMNNSFLSEAVYRNRTPIDIDIYSLKADIEQKLGKGKIGYGAKASYVITQNAFDFYNVSGGNDTKVLEKSNKFKFKENINAVYVSYQRQLNDKIDLQAGLRAEQTNSNGILTRADGVYQSDNDVKRSYLDLFPSASLSYKLNNKNSFSLAYSRRIDRPSYQDLNPFENKLDELTYQKGNAFLRPQYTDNVQIKHIFAGKLSTDFSYSYVRDYATEILDTTNKNSTYLQNQNLATQQILSWHISSPLAITKWWNGYLEFWHNTYIFDGIANNKKVHMSIPHYGVYSTQSFNLGNGYSAEMSGWWSSPTNWGATGKGGAQGNVDFGIQKSLMQKRATLKVTATDIFATQSPWRITNNFGGLRLKGNGKYESQTIRVNFTYRFGSAQIKNARQRQTGLESESNRIKGN
ncbi:TonB-dependent receptor family protein [Ferruginibacter lapsinanis]|uniref:outer membrane beta-barrel family protein n=1 Tax=Ferruginibacter lapsinanis TaxID=563172 RepID=UPI001E5878F0|nr:outer membrane beta-barrel family protein [Ferruginibacter lapsinanis]UEG49548.1 TonB-dependent receptor family protein [Ferruginibacter lapsinanis]